MGARRGSTWLAIAGVLLLLAPRAGMSQVRSANSMESNGPAASNAATPTVAAASQTSAPVAASGTPFYTYTPAPTYYSNGVAYTSQPTAAYRPTTAYAAPQTYYSYNASVWTPITAPTQPTYVPIQQQTYTTTQPIYVQPRANYVYTQPTTTAAPATAYNPATTTYTMPPIYVKQPYIIQPVYQQQAPVVQSAPTAPANPATPSAPAQAVAAASASPVAAPPVAASAARPTNPAQPTVPAAPTVAAAPAQRNGPVDAQYASLSTPAPRQSPQNAPFVDSRENLPNGQAWLEYDISPYTSRIDPSTYPERAVRHWILSETGNETWHEGDVSSLLVNSKTVRVYHNPAVQEKVADVVGRFIYYQPGKFRCRVRLIDAHEGLRARKYPYLQPVGGSNTRNQAWLVSNAEADRLVVDLSGMSRKHLLVDKSMMEVVNGQPAKVIWEPDDRVGTGMALRFQPLIAIDAATVDVEVDAALGKDIGSYENRSSYRGDGRAPASDARAASLAGRYSIPPGKQLLLSLGAARDLVKPLWRHRDSEVLVLLEIIPDGNNMVNGARVAAKVDYATPEPARPRPQVRPEFAPSRLTGPVY